MEPKEAPDDSTDDEIDPRIKVELESLNQAASDVNRLEKEINEARNKYQETFYECSQELETLRKTCGGKINKARAYYETKELSKEAQSEAMLSARKFQSANGVYMAAKETISLAEQRLKDDKAAGLSPAWQEMLNHALIRVMESEREKTRSEKEHLEKSAVFAAMEKKLHVIEKKHRKSIEKAKLYFDYKKELQLKLQQIKQTIEDLQQAILGAKSRYAVSLKSLETISDGIHETRRQKVLLMYPREPGVGAEEETDAIIKELPRLAASRMDLDTISCTSSVDDALCYSDSDDHEDRGKETSKDTPTTCNIDSVAGQKSNDPTGSAHKEQAEINESVRTVRVKGGRKLRKTKSLPSYVVEDDKLLETQVRSIQIETDNVLLNIETNPAQRVEVEGESKARDLTEEQDQVGESSRPKPERLILDPSALCSRNVEGRAADGDT